MGACVSCVRPIGNSDGNCQPQGVTTGSVLIAVDSARSSSGSSSSGSTAGSGSVGGYHHTRRRGTTAAWAKGNGLRGSSTAALPSLPPLRPCPSVASLFNVLPEEGTRGAGPPATTATLEIARLDGATLLNQYLIVRYLGRGVSGRVFLVLDVLTRRQLALKALRRAPPGPMLSKSGRRRDPHANLAREIDIMSRLQHPNLPRLYEVIDDPGHAKILLIMTLAEGGPVLTRASLEAGRKLPEAQARHIFRGMSQGLAKLHSLGIVHGDLKPENVLQGSSILLSDFGCSRVEGEGAETTRPRGTPAFLAPELASPGAGPCDRASDVYALGASLFTLLYGTIPFAATSVAELFEALQTKPLVLPPDPAFSAGLKELLLGCLDKDPRTRWKLERVLEHPWVTGPEDVAGSKGHGSSSSLLTNPLAALLTADLVVHNVSPGHPLPPPGSHPALLFVLAGGVEVECHAAPSTAPVTSPSLSPEVSPYPRKSLSLEDPAGGLFAPLESTPLATPSSVASLSPSPSPDPVRLVSERQASATVGLGFRSPPTQLWGGDWERRSPAARLTGSLTKREEEGPPWGAPKVTLPEASAVQELPSPEQGTHSGPVSALLQRGMAAAAEALEPLRRHSGAWLVARREPGEFIGASQLLAGGPSAGKAMDGVPGPQEQTLVAGPHGARYVDLPWERVAAAWKADPLIHLQLRQLGWREDTELTALRAMLLLTKQLTSGSDMIM